MFFFFVFFSFFIVKCNSEKKKVCEMWMICDLWWKKEKQNPNKKKTKKTKKRTCKKVSQLHPNMVWYLLFFFYNNSSQKKKKKDCPHILKEDHFKEFLNGLDVNGSNCSSCKESNLESKENWLCGACHSIFCSRYVRKHFKKHNETNEEHCLGISLSDLSVWCYECDVI